MFKIPEGYFIYVTYIAILILIFTINNILGWFFGRIRRNKLQIWAESNQLKFNPSKDKEFSSKFPDLEFLQDYSEYAFNICRGKWQGREIITFDNTFDNCKYYNSGVIIGCEHKLKPLYIRSEKFLDKITAAVGYEDINFESAEFSREFYVKAKNKKWAYDVIHTRAMSYLLSQDRYNIQFSSKYVMIWWPVHVFKVKRFEQVADMAIKLIDMLPDYAKEELEATY